MQRGRGGRSASFREEYKVVPIQYIYIIYNTQVALGKWVQQSAYKYRVIIV